MNLNCVINQLIQFESKSINSGPTYPNITHNNNGILIRRYSFSFFVFNEKRYSYLLSLLA